MGHLIFRFALTLGIAVALVNGFVVSKPGKYSDVSPQEKNTKYTTAFVPNSLKIDDSAFEGLMGQLHEQLSGQLNVKAPGYFPTDTETDDWDQLENLQNYDESLEEETMDTLFAQMPTEASVDVEFGKREFSFSKILAINKNGTKTFSKMRQSTKVKGDANANVNGDLNTTLATSASGSASFSSNITLSTKGKDVDNTVSGDVTFSSKSKSSLEKRKLVSASSVESVAKVQIPAINGEVTVNTTVQTSSETFKLPFRSYMTLFSSKIGTNTDYDAGSQSKLAGEVTSHVAFANKNVSLTKSCTKAFLRTSSKAASTLDLENNDDDDENVADENAGVTQVVVLKAKTHTWTKVVSKSSSQIVLDVFTCTKTRIFGKAIQKGKMVVFVGSGQVAWEKSQMTINAESLDNLAPHEYGIHFITKQIETNGFIGSTSMGDGN